MIAKKIASNVMYFSLHWFALTILGYLFYIILGKMLIPEQYGILFTVTSSFYIFSVFTGVGFVEALPKIVPELLKANKMQEARSLISFSIKFVFIFSLVISSLLFLFSNNISSLLYHSQQMSVPIKLLSVVLFSGTIMLVLKSILQGMQRFKEIFYGDLLGNTLKIVLAIVLVLSGLGAAGGIISWAAWFVITSLAFLFVILRIGPYTKKEFNKKRLFKYGILSTLSLFSIYFIQQGGILLLGIFSTLEESAFFATAFVFGQFLMFVPGILLGAIFPSLSEFWESNKGLVNTLLSKSIKASLILTLPATVLFIAFSEFLIKLFYNAEYLVASSLFPGYLFGSFLFGLNLLLLITLYSARKPHIRASILLLAALLNFILSLIMIPMFGMQGAVMAFLTAQIVIFGLSLYFVNRIMDLVFSKRNLLFIPVFTIFSLIILSVNYTESVAMKILLVAIAILSYIILLFKLKIINNDDILLLQHFPSMFGKIEKR